MKKEAIVSKLLHLTREVKFTEPTVSAIHTRFMTGGLFGLPGMGGVGLEWWYTPQAVEAAEEIGRMLIQHEAALANGDAESFKKTIFKSLEQGVMKWDIFDKTKVCLRKCECLFEAKGVNDVRTFGKQLYDVVVTELVNSIDNWLLVYPLKKMTGPPFSLAHDGIAILPLADEESWVSYKAKYPEMKQCSGDLISSSLWLLCEGHGTQRGAQKDAVFRMRKFLAVLFCFLFEKGRYVLSRSMATPDTYSYQFPLNPGKVGCGYIRSSCGELLFPPVNKLEISHNDYAKIEKWYGGFEAAAPEAKSRAATAANFVNYATTHQDIERFLHYFISLDALFGSRNRVEKGIIEGFEKIFAGDEKWAARGEWLFDLRNELTHGGSCTIEQWERLVPYRKHFKTYPEDDVEVAALQSLKLFFD